MRYGRFAKARSDGSDERNSGGAKNSCGEKQNAQTEQRRCAKGQVAACGAQNQAAAYGKNKACGGVRQAKGGRLGMWACKVVGTLLRGMLVRQACSAARLRTGEHATDSKLERAASRATRRRAAHGCGWKT